MTEQHKAVEAALPDSFRTKVSRVTDDVLAHVERICGDLSRSPTVIEFDDDYSVLRHNIYAVIGLAFRDNQEGLDALSRPTQTADAVEFIRKQADEFLPDMDTKSLDARHVSLMAAIRNGVNYGAALSRTATSEVEPVGLRDAANGLLHFFPLEEGENERGCRFGDAVADLRDALSSTPTPTHDSGLAGELAAELDALITKSSGSANASMTKALEIANFVTQHDIEILTALRSPYIKPTPTPDSGLADKLNTRDLHFAIKALQMSEDDETRNRGYLIGSFFEKLTALQSNSDSELLREALKDIARQHLTTEMEDPDGDYEFAYEAMIKVARQALARLEQGAA